MSFFQLERVVVNKRKGIQTDISCSAMTLMFSLFGIQLIWGYGK